MRVLWITVLGSWTLPLAQCISKEVELTIMVPTKNPDKIELVNDIHVHYVHFSTKDLSGIPMSKEVVNRYCRLIDDIDPDIIHVHGTERNFAQIQNYVKHIPVIVSIQGIMKGYIPHLNNYIQEEEISRSRSLKNLIGQGGYNAMRKLFKRNVFNYETEILQQTKYFFCRTNWDKAWVSFHNPKARIFHGEELLRDSFYSKAGKWSIVTCSKYRVFMPSGFNPVKGLHHAIKAIALLKSKFPNICLAVPGMPAHILAYEGIKSRIIGEEYINYIKNLITTNNLQENIVLLPRLNDEEMANEMIKSHLFLSPSSIDNSPNAIGEATMIGMPIVTTPVGGVPSMLKDEDSCLFASPGDEYSMAYQMMRIFESTSLAERLSKGAHNVALVRHDKGVTAKQYLEAYKKIISTTKPSYD